MLWPSQTKLYLPPLFYHDGQKYPEIMSQNCPSLNYISTLFGQCNTKKEVTYKFKLLAILCSMMKTPAMLFYPS